PSGDFGGACGSTGTFLFDALSSDSGDVNVYQMSLSGTGKKKLTQGHLNASPDCSPDGKQFLYVSSLKGKLQLMMAAINGGEPRPLIDDPRDQAHFSADGSKIAVLRTGEVVILAAKDGVRLKSFPLKFEQISNLRWLPDGSAVSFVVQRGQASNIWEQAL